MGKLSVVESQYTSYTEYRLLCKSLEFPAHPEVVARAP